MRDAKRNYYSTKIAGQKFDPKRAWKNIDSLLGKQKKQTLVNELSLNENCFTSSKSIAEGFNDYFSNIGPELATKIDSSNCNIEMYVRAARVILGISNEVNHRIALRALGWEPFKIERKKAKGKMMNKILNKMGPQSLINLFS